MRLLKNIVCFFLFTFCVTANAQDTKALLKKANRMFEAQAYKQAIDLYIDVLTYDNPIEAKEKLAHSYRKVSQFEKAEYWYRLIIPVLKKRKLNFYLAQVLQGQGKYDEAAELYMGYADIYPRSEVFAEACRNPEQFHKNKEAYKIDNLPFNSPSSEFGPVIFRDNQLVFASSQDGNKKPSNDYYLREENYLDLFVTQPIVSEWSKPKRLKGSINSPFHDGPACFDKYYQQVWFTRNTSSRGKGVKEQTKKLHLQLFSATVNGTDKWTDVIPFEHNNENYSVAHPTLADNGRLLYFSSNMPGGFGNSDIWVCVKVDSTWSKPKNLGPDINTPEDEQFPYIHEDGTLYFSSNGHPGLGGFDIFFSKQVKRTWSRPQNMGSPVNSSRDDFSIVYDKRGNGYFASNREGGKGADDIYRFSMIGNTNYPKSIAGTQKVEEAQYAPSVRNMNIIDGSNEIIDNTNVQTAYVLPDETNKPSKKSKQNKKKKEKVSKTPKNDIGNNSKPKKEKKPKTPKNNTKEAKNKAKKEKTNNNKNSKPTKEKTAKSKQKNNIKTTKNKPKSPKNTNITSAQVPENSINAELNLGPVQFKGKSATLSEDVLQQIAPVILFARENPRVKIRIESFTDSRGDARSNVELAKMRLSKIVEFFYQNGINQSNLELVARGETGILNQCVDGVNCNAKDHRFNQRVIFTKIDRVNTSNNIAKKEEIVEEEFIDFEKNKEAANKEKKQKQSKKSKTPKDKTAKTKKKDKTIKDKVANSKPPKANEKVKESITLPKLNPTSNIEGFTYTILVGPYSNIDIEKKNILKNINLEQRLSTIHTSKKIIELLRLKDIAEAEQLLQYIKAKGIKKAKVVVYRNGQMTDYKLSEMKKTLNNGN